MKHAYVWISYKAFRNSPTIFIEKESYDRLRSMKKIEIRPELESLKKYSPGKSTQALEKELGITNSIKLASNENPFGCPFSPEELAQAIQNGYHYPDFTVTPFLPLLAEHYQVNESQLILGNGSDDILQMIGLAFLNKGDEVITATHTFSVYDHVAKLMGATLVKSEMPNYRYAIPEIQTCITSKTKLIFIANPNNPTGTVLSADKIKPLCVENPSILVVLDEAYVEFADQNLIQDTTALLNTVPNLICLRTASKCYGLAGYRIGYGISNSAIIDTLQKVRMPFNVNSIALVAAELAFKNKTFIEKTLENNKTQKEWLYQELERLGLEYIKSQANFICFFTEKAASDLYTELLIKGVIVRPLTNFGLDKGIRVSIGKDTDNQRFINALKSCLNL